jgi:hypothetical protein
VPFQEASAAALPDEAKSWYAMVVDGEVLDRKEARYRPLREVQGSALVTELGQRIIRRLGFKID